MEIEHCPVCGSEDFCECDPGERITELETKLIDATTVERTLTEKCAELEAKLAVATAAERGRVIKILEAMCLCEAWDKEMCNYCHAEEEIRGGE